MDAPYYNGDENRELSGEQPDLARTFWRAFHYAERTNNLMQFFRIYEPIRSFASLVAEAKRRLQKPAA